MPAAIKVKQGQETKEPDDVDWPADATKAKSVFADWNNTAMIKAPDLVAAYAGCPNSIITLSLVGHKGLEHVQEFFSAAESLCVAGNVEFRHMVRPGQF